MANKEVIIGAGLAIALGVISYTTYSLGTKLYNRILKSADNGEDITVDVGEDHNVDLNIGE